ncbi:M14 family metallopeptidase [Frateuria aurantia]|uniref:Putative deacylase n=1 Tax=Frateuria aurantia (strain ATCC 33424 / DSM 6220 / KCTC 2777 / LMG 1558 / NBRC 3245 / NCIMB 13370) TaxID=767434 RepID=H8L025_FRAAD|nr:M14 family metallocarboxypeptidase [Frateuria aurantia]AFC86237.1 putative deacylase [Frateuria aurantia DSM 6220]
MSNEAFFPIGTPGQPWGSEEKARWLATQTRKRSYHDEVVREIDDLRTDFEVSEYGRHTYGHDIYPLYAVRSKSWNQALPTVLVTGGVHGYETSGVHGALQFLKTRAGGFADRANLLVVPCVSPWGYEHIQRWNPDAIDPNRSFREDSPAAESAALWALTEPLRGDCLMHIDLHETTDTDDSEFRPALAARDGKPLPPGGIPDGFYLVDDSEHPQRDFQQAIIAAVQAVTHIAPADADGMIIGSPVVAPGVIEYPVKQLGLCAGITHARFVTTTEVYPDSPKATPQQCNDAQVAAICAAINHALAQA